MKNAVAFLVSFAIPVGAYLIMFFFTWGNTLSLGGNIFFLIFISLSIFVPPVILWRKGEESRKFGFFGALLFFCLLVAIAMVRLLISIG